MAEAGDVVPGLEWSLDQARQEVQSRAFQHATWSKLGATSTARRGDPSDAHSVLLQLRKAQSVSPEDSTTGSLSIDYLSGPTSPVDGSTPSTTFKAVNDSNDSVIDNVER